MTCVALVGAGVGPRFTADSVLERMTLGGVRSVAVADGIPPIFGCLVWRSGDRDPALARVLEVSEQALPAVV